MIDRVRRARLVRLTAAAGALMLLSPAPPAAAAAPGVSLDGQTWSVSVAQPLLDPDVVWVPGDQRSVAFFIRNNSGEPADLEVDLVHVRGELRWGRDLIWTASWDGEDRAVTGRLVAAPMPDGGTRRLVLHVLMPGGAGNSTQQRAARADVRITLRQQLSGSAGLAASGAAASTTAVLFGALTASAAGLAVLHHRRRTVGAARSRARR